MSVNVRAVPVVPICCEPKFAGLTFAVSVASGAIDTSPSVNRRFSMPVSVSMPSAPTLSVTVTTPAACVIV